MNSFPQSEDILCSDGNGTYDISFFSASIGHSIEKSKAVFAKFSGGMLSSFTDAWRQAEKHERIAFLLEHHEIAHHALMFSTPAGVLNWRLNQVIARDIIFIFSKCRAYGVSFPDLRNPASVLNSITWKREFLSRTDGVAHAEKTYLIQVIESLENLLLLRKLFFEKDAAASLSDMTFGTLVSLLNSTYQYLSDRCDCRFITKWKTRLPPEAKVFQEGKSFNIMDIAECHAIAAELFILRALADKDGLANRLAECRSGSFGKAITAAISLTKGVNELGFSPHQMQIAALLACCTSIDSVADDETERFVEDELPWWKFTSAEIFKASSIGAAILNLGHLFARPLFGKESIWLKFAAGETAIAEVNSATDHGDRSAEMELFLTSLASFGLDMQAYAIHQGADLNMRFLMTVLADGQAQPAKFAFKRVSADSWRGQLFLSVPMIEYTDEIFFVGFELDQIYLPDNPIRRLPIFENLKKLPFQLLAHIINGAGARNAYAAYAGKIVPRSRILQHKLAKFFHDDSYAAEVCALLTNMFDHGLSIAIDAKHLRVLPETVAHDRYI